MIGCYVCHTNVTCQYLKSANNLLMRDLIVGPQYVVNRYQRQRIDVSIYFCLLCQVK